MITDIFLKIFATQTAVISRVVAGFVVAGITFLALRFFNWEVSEEDKRYVSGVAGTAVAWLITEIVDRIKTKKAAELQKAINAVNTTIIPTVAVDGLAHDKTLQAVQTMAVTVNRLTEDLNKTETRQLSAEVKKEVHSTPSNV